MPHWLLSCSCQGVAIVGLWWGGSGIGLAAETVIWRDATPATPLEHAVMVQSRFATSHVRVRLEGPSALVTPAAARDEGGAFTVYRIAMAKDEEPRIVGVGIDATDLKDVRLGPAEFLVAPSRCLTDGSPQPMVESVYEARRILGEPLLDEVAAAAGHQSGAPTHLCLAVDYKHHFERVKVRDAARGLVLFSPTGAAEATETTAVSVVDDFGTNRLELSTMSRVGVWVVVSDGGAP